MLMRRGGGGGMAVALSAHLWKEGKEGTPAAAELRTTIRWVMTSNVPFKAPAVSVGVARP